jgi:hypothetical protein
MKSAQSGAASADDPNPAQSTDFAEVVLQFDARLRAVDEKYALLRNDLRAAAGKSRKTDAREEDRVTRDAGRMPGAGIGGDEIHDTIVASIKAQDRGIDRAGIDRLFAFAISRMREIDAMEPELRPMNEYTFLFHLARDLQGLPNAIHEPYAGKSLEQLIVEDTDNALMGLRLSADFVRCLGARLHGREEADAAGE